jgi:hypothetical protein
MDVVYGTHGGQITDVILVGKRAGNKLLVRLRRKFHNIKVDMKETGWHGMDRINLAQDREKWRRVVIMVMNR